MHLSNKIFLLLNMILKLILQIHVPGLVNLRFVFFFSQGLQKMHSKFSLQNTQELKTQVGYSCLHPQYSKRTNEMRSLQLVASTINHEPRASLHQRLPFPLGSQRRQNTNKASRLSHSTLLLICSYNWELRLHSVCWNCHTWRNIFVHCDMDINRPVFKYRKTKLDT